MRGGRRAGREARTALTQELGGRLPDDCLRDVHLVVTEIVNNSVVHGHVGEDGWIALEWSLSDASIRIDVRDTGEQGDPRPRRPDYVHGGGFGLFIVDHLCSSWGIDHDPRLRVWFELPLDTRS